MNITYDDVFGHLKSGLSIDDSAAYLDIPVEQIHRYIEAAIFTINESGRISLTELRLFKKLYGGI